jgi:PAS domain S-box-containing protein
VLQTLLDAGHIGLARAAHDGEILSRHGSLSDWLPDAGGRLVDAPLLCGYEDDIHAISGKSGSDLVLACVGTGPAAQRKLDIRIFWQEHDRELLVVSTPADEAAKIHGRLVQVERERRVLEQQVAEQERALSEANRLLHVFVTRIPAAVAMLDQSLGYINASGRWVQEFGPVTTGRSMLQDFPAMSRRWRDVLAHCARTGDEHSGLDKQKQADGDSVWLQWDVQPWHRPDGSVAGIVLFVEDISKTVRQTAMIQESARRLKSANIELRRFSLAISHDLRAPLRHIRTFADFLAEDHASGLDAKGLALLNDIRRGAHKMSRMIDSLLKYARISAMPITIKPVDLRMTIADAVNTLGIDPLTTQSRVLCADLVTVGGDPELLAMVFQNLMENALKYGNQDALTIKISTALENERWCVRFSDNGRGLPRATDDRAFDLFQRLGHDDDIPGAGVGLTICKRIVELHGGTMWIDHDHSPGLALCFTLPKRPASRTLPRQLSEQITDRSDR